MSRSVASLVLVRGGKRQVFEEVWGTPYRDLLWGPTDFERWASGRDEAEYEPEELAGLVVADYDRKTLGWFDQEAPNAPAIRQLYNRLLAAAWPSYQISNLTETQAYSYVRSLEIGDHEYDEDDKEDSSDTLIEQEDPLGDRYETIADASMDDYSDEELDDAEEGDYESDEDDESDAAWISIIDGEGEPRHRKLYELSQDILTANAKAVPMLAKQKPASIPTEMSTLEGMCIDLPQKKIHLWGGQNLQAAFPRIQSAWKDWDVSWMEGGYRTHCQIVGTPGRLMNDAKGLASFIPFMLQTEKVDMSHIMGEMGGAIKRTAIKAVGCLTLVLAFPILLTGLFMSKFKESLYAVATLAVVVIAIFKFAEWRFKSKFRNSALGQMARPEAEDNRPPVAGPLNKNERQSALDRLLASAGLPSWKEIQPHVD